MCQTFFFFFKCETKKTVALNAQKIRKTRQQHLHVYNLLHMNNVLLGFVFPNGECKQLLVLTTDFLKKKNSLKEPMKKWFSLLLFLYVISSVFALYSLWTLLNMRNGTECDRIIFVFELWLSKIQHYQKHELIVGI